MDDVVGWVGSVGGSVVVVGLVVVVMDDRRARQVEFSRPCPVLLKMPECFSRLKSHSCSQSTQNKQKRNKKQIECCQKFGFRFRDPSILSLPLLKPFYPACLYVDIFSLLPPLPSTPVLLQNWKVELPFSF
jgi:hypothetical protein